MITNLHHQAPACCRPAVWEWLSTLSCEPLPPRTDFYPSQAIANLPSKRSHRNPASLRRVIASQPAAIVHNQVAGPFKIIPGGGADSTAIVCAVPGFDHSFFPETARGPAWIVAGLLGAGGSKLKDAPVLKPPARNLKFGRFEW